MHTSCFSGQSCDISQMQIPNTRQLPKRATKDEYFYLDYEEKGLTSLEIWVKHCLFAHIISTKQRKYMYTQENRQFKVWNKSWNILPICDHICQSKLFFNVRILDGSDERLTQVKLVDLKTQSWENKPFSDPHSLTLHIYLEVDLEKLIDQA